MPWKTMDVREQRVQFVVAAMRREKSLTALCEEFGVSRPTGRLWLRRYRQQGVAGIAERSRRPARSPRLTSPELEEQVVQLRRHYPDWGAHNLQLARSPVRIVAAQLDHLLLQLRRGQPRAACRAAAPLGDARNPLLPIAPQPQPPSRTRYSKLLTQRRQRLLPAHRRHHELHPLFPYVHGLPRHLGLHSRARCARAEV